MRHKNFLLQLVVVFSITFESLSANPPQQLQQQATEKLTSHANVNSVLAVNNIIKPMVQPGSVTKSVAAPVVIANDASHPVSQSVSTSLIQEAQTIESSSIAPGYGNEDPIIYLDYSTIDDEVLRKRTASFVYFNANFNHCRNCHKFFEIWRELAVDIRWWKQIIRLSTINCSDEDNIDVCRRAGVTQFPQVKYYWINSNSLDQDGVRLRILGKSVHAMRHLIMDKVMDSYIEHNKLLARRPNLNQKSPAIATQAAPAGSQPINPLVSLMGPMLGQLLISGGSGGSSGSPNNSGGLGSMMSILSGKGGTSLMSNLGGIQGVVQLISGLLGASSTHKNVQPLPNNWPELEPIEAIDAQSLLAMLPLDPAKNIGALLIMETQEFLYTGSEVMLDLSPYSNQTYIARVRDDRSQLSKNLTRRDDIQAPSLIFITALGEPKLILAAPKYTNDEDLRRALVRAFERRQIKYPVKRIWSMPPQVNKPGLASDSQEDEESLAKVHQVHMNDLSNTIRASLMEQVFRHSDLSDDQYNALVKYVYVLINYFPFNNNESHKFFKRLHTWLQNQVSPVDVSEYKKQFHDIDEVLPSREWIACKSLSNTKSIPSKSRKSGFIFESPAQLSKVVSNITRLFRGQQQQAAKLKRLFSVFTTNSQPVMLDPNQKSQPPAMVNSTMAPNVVTASVSVKPEESGKRDDSPIERIIKSLTSGSLGSDSSILKLISTALTGGANDDSGKTGKSKFAREYPCGVWKLAHVMVVNEYIKDSPRKDVKHVVLHGLYQYMLHLYSCPTCGNRISDVSGEFRIKLDEYLRDQGDSVMLVWKIHNRVNKRLESELRPGSPTKLQFPSESLCPKCRGTRFQSDFVSTPNWHEKQVLNFLVHHYRPQSLILTANSTDSSSAPGLNNVHQYQLTILQIFLLLSSWVLLSKQSTHVDPEADG